MSILFPSTDGDPAALAAQARRLADDVERLARGDLPTASDLASAPILDWWRPAIRQAQALIGVVGGHPHIGDRRTALTTELMAIDLAHQGGFARTWSRYYRLGRPLGLPDGRRQ